MPATCGTSRSHGVEAIRAISYIVRDRNWGTYNPEITNLHDRAGRGRLPGQLRRGLPRRAAGLRLLAPGSRPTLRAICLRGRGRGAHRLRHQPHRLRRPAPGRGRQRRAGRGRAGRRQGRAEPLSRADRPDLPVQGHPRADPRAACRACASPAGWRATRSRWRTSATGWTPPTRPMSARWPCPGPTPLPAGREADPARLAHALRRARQERGRGRRRRGRGHDR